MRRRNKEVETSGFLDGEEHTLRLSCSVGIPTGRGVASGLSLVLMGTQNCR